MTKINVNSLEQRLLHGTSNTRAQSEGRKSFDQVMQKVQTNEVRFSKHAAQRISSREVEMNSEDWLRLKKGIDKAREKGVKDVLILIDNKVFIANVKSGMIITTMKDEQIRENVFTNIDGTVIV